MPGDKHQQQVRERVWVEKFDHSGDTPVLVDTTFVEKRYDRCQMCGQLVPEVLHKDGSPIYQCECGMSWSQP